jgi:hypothetical protein
VAYGLAAGLALRARRLDRAVSQARRANACEARSNPSTTSSSSSSRGA